MFEIIFISIIGLCAIIFNGLFMPFVSAICRPATMDVVNAQLTNEVAISSAMIQTGLMPDAIIQVSVNVIFLILVVITAVRLFKKCN